MAILRGSLRLDGAPAGWSLRPALSRAHRGCESSKVPRWTPTRAPLVLQPVSGPFAAFRTLQRHWWRTSAAASNDLAEGGGNGDSGGGDGGGAGGSGGSSGDSSNEGEDNNPGLSGNMWMLAGAAATVLAIFLVRQKLRQQQHPPHSQARGAAPAPSSQQPSGDELATLTRLTQEAFAELVKVKERLDELEEDAGIGPGSAQAGTAGLSAGGGGIGASRGRPGAAGGAQQQQHPHGRHCLAGVLRLGGGLLWAQDGGGSGAAAALRAAGLKLGTDALLQLSAVVRGGRDSVHAECRLDAAAERASLRKVLYNCRLGSSLRLVLAPFGARGRDVAYTLNPLAGQGLSGMVRDGSPLHQPVLGSLAGVAMEAHRAWFSAGYFARALPSGGAAASLLAQAVVAPTDSLSVGLTLLEQRSQAAPAAAGAAEPGGLGTAGGRVSGSGSGAALVGLLGRAAAAAADALGVSTACEARQLGAMLAWRLGRDAVVHGWAAADGAEVERRVRAGELGAAARPQEWGLVLGSYPDGTGTGWALGVGRSAAAAAAAAGGAAATGSSSAGGASAVLPNLLELSLQWNLGEGLLLSPGLLLLTRGGGKDPIAFMGLRSTWAF